MSFVKIFKIDDNSLKKARDYILDDKLVAFPTETVYGLGANAFSDSAVKKIYEAKGRPADNPLIVHVHIGYDISSLVYDDLPYVKKLRERFLPGPLTLVYKSKKTVSELCSNGLDTLAVRIPSHQGAQRFLKAVDLPIAAPSANRSKHVSPVTAEHVLADLNDSVEMILDGGRCNGGIESTVLDVTTDTPVILRKGLVTAEMIKSVVGRCEYAASTSELNARSPGTKYRHYCPQTKTLLFEEGDEAGAMAKYEEYVSLGKRPAIMAVGKACRKMKAENVFDLGDSGKEMAEKLYYFLREAEKYDILIGIKFTPCDEIAAGVENRFLKAFG